MIRVSIVISGRGYDAVADAPPSLELPDGATVDDALAELRERLPANVSLPAACLVALSGAHLGTLAGHANRPLANGDELALIAPVAGG